MADRKIGVCHLCGAQTNRFADHLKREHHERNYRTEKELRDEKFHLLAVSSFTTSSKLQEELDELSGGLGSGLYSTRTVKDYLLKKGFTFSDTVTMTRGMAVKTFAPYAIVHIFFEQLNASYVLH